MPLRVSVRYTVLELRVPEIRAAYDAVIRAQLKKAVGAMIERMARFLPVFTGMSAGALRRVGMMPGVGASVPVTPKMSALRFLADKNQWKGMQQASAEFDFSNPDRPIFRWDIGVKHFIENERRSTALLFTGDGRAVMSRRGGGQASIYDALVTKPPWRLLTKHGYPAFNEYLRDNLRRELLQHVDIRRFVTRTYSVER